MGIKIMNKKELLEELQEEKIALAAMQEEKEEAEDKIRFLKHPIFITKQSIEYLESELKKLNKWSKYNE